MKITTRAALTLSTASALLLVGAVPVFAATMVRCVTGAGTLYTTTETACTSGGDVVYDYNVPGQTTSTTVPGGTQDTTGFACGTDTNLCLRNYGPGYECQSNKCVQTSTYTGTEYHGSDTIKSGEVQTTGGQVQTSIPSGVSSGGTTAVSSGGGFPTFNVSGLTSYAATIIAFINAILVPLLIAIAFIVFLWGVANAYILHPGDEERRKTGHEFILWAVIAFVVIFSLWGLVYLVGSTLGLGASGHPPVPTL